MDPREQAAQGMMQAGIGSLGARSTLPRFTNREEAIAREHGGHPDQLWDQKINSIISEGHRKQDRWEELGGPNYLFEPSPGKTFNFPQYPILNKGKIGPGWTEAGIPATNQGYKVMNALSMDPSADDFFLRELFNYGKRYFPGYDPENDELRQKKYRELMDQLGGKADPIEGALPGGMTGLPRKPNPWLADEYNDKILRDLQEPYTTDEELNNLLEGLEPEDLGMEPHLEAQSQWKRPDNMEKTIKSLELRPEFEGWTHDEIKYWIINQARANRGGIIGLL